MIQVQFLFTDFAADDVESTALEDQIRDEGTLPTLSHIETYKAVGEVGTATVFFDTETALTGPQSAALATVVGAHDSDASALALAKDHMKALVDVRTADYHALRVIAGLSEASVDTDGDDTKTAIDAASDTAGVDAAAAADPRPVLSGQDGR